MTISYVDAPQVRHAETQWGDSLQRVALRELGDAARWPELVELNSLSPPYLVDSLADAPSSGRVIVRGGLILVPALAGQSRDLQTEEDVFGVDLLLSDGELSGDSGDFATVAGRQNLWQAITIRIRTDPGELLFHPTYGCEARGLVGAGAGPNAAQLAAFFVKEAVLDDPRVDSVPKSSSVVSGDSLSVSVEVAPVSGAAQLINMVV